MSAEESTATPVQNVKPPADMKALDQLRWYLEDEKSGYRRRLEMMVGQRLPQFTASLLSLSSSSSKFKQVEPTSIIASAVIAASLDLPINQNMGYAWIIPYGKLAQFQVGYKGWIQLAQRTGKYAGMNASIVTADMWQGWDLIGDPMIDWSKFDASQDAVGYCFAWKLITGFTKIVYWDRATVQAHAERYSKAYRYGLTHPTERNAKDSPWFTHFDQMGLKTVISNSLRKWGIMSVEYQQMQVAFERDQSAAIDIDAVPIYPDADGLSVDDDSDDAAEDTIRRPEPIQTAVKSLPEPQVAASFTVQDVKAAGLPTREAELVGGAEPKDRSERIMVGEIKGRTKAEKKLREDFLDRQQQTTKKTLPAATSQVTLNLTPPTNGSDDTAASPGAIATIKIKMQRDIVSLNDLQKIPEFKDLASIDDLKQRQVNTVLKWLRDPRHFEEHPEELYAN
ncbi:MAG: recombination protein RecT [Acidobacteriota bacterium]|jgi:recombination protein RecT